ncbi:MAG: serine/threonine-protein kinase [Gemmataceae bacterium]
MGIICPYCSHSMQAKGVRAGRFTPKCAKCTRSFQLTVTLQGETPTYKTVGLPEPPAPTFDPNATAPSAAEIAVKPAPARPAPVRPAPAPAPASAALDATVAPEEGISQSPDFSVNASALRSQAVASPDVTAALPDTSAVTPHPGVNLDATEADLSEAGKTPARSRGKDDDDMPDVLGGYQVVKELGRGGMGAVYLARQVSLDRPVALKVMNTQWASNPNFLVRFTREAYAAAQLVHHNVVQVYDIGEDKGINYFSMEFVEGRSLGDLLKKDGRLAPEVAAGYILQAARGLKFAHDRGMIHRDIKPDNLMLNNQGVVKVADLGLVRTPGMEESLPRDEVPVEAPQSRGKGASGRTLSSLSGVTMAGQAMGTPAYMAPEQARDATSVDHRADIYSLGCTLYVLVTGRPVFQGASALEVMTKHAMDPIVRPDMVVKDVPKALSDVVVKMIAKKPDERYQSMDETIQALEAFLGLAGQDRASQMEQHVRTLEKCAKGFRDNSLGQLRSWVLLGFFGGLAALFLLLILAGGWRIAGAVLGLGTLTAAAYLVIHGTAQRSFLFLRTRDFLLSLGWVELGKLALGALLFVGVLFLFGQFWYWLLAGLLGVGLALGLHYTLDRRIARQRSEHVEEMDSLLRTLRVRGLSEDALQEFVAKYAGEHWEEFFEALFGYEAKLAARQQYGIGSRGRRPRFGAWRDPIVRWLDRMQRQRQESRERRHLQAIEQKNLVAQGIDASQARAQAEAVADAMVQKAAEIKQEAALMVLEETVAPEQGLEKAPVKKAPPPKRVNVQDLFQVAAAPPKQTVRPGLMLERLLNLCFGSTIRFVSGAALVLVCLAWLAQNRLLPSLAEAGHEFTYSYILAQLRGGDLKSLPIPGPEILGQMFSGIHVGIAGLVLLVSSIYRYWKIGFLVLLGTAVMVVGPVSGLVPALGPLSPALTSLAIGGGVALLGFLFGRGT